MHKFITPLLASLALTLVLLPGCAVTSDGLNQSVEAAKLVRNATTQAVADTRAAALTAEDPKERDRLNKAADTMEAKVKQIDATLGKATVVIDALNSKDPSALQAVATNSGVPYLGLVVALGLAGYKAYQKAQADSALKQVVTSVEAAYPEKDEATKAKLLAGQDVKTQMKVEAIKKDSGNN